MFGGTHVVLREQGVCKIRRMSDVLISGWAVFQNKVGGSSFTSRSLSGGSKSRVHLLVRHFLCASIE